MAAKLTATHTHMGSTYSSISLASISRISRPTSKQRINPCELYIIGGREDAIRIYTSQSYTETKKAYQLCLLPLVQLQKYPSWPKTHTKYPFKFRFFYFYTIQNKLKNCQSSRLILAYYISILVWRLSSFMNYWQARVGKTLCYQYLIKTYIMISGLDRPIYITLLKLSENHHITYELP